MYIWQIPFVAVFFLIGCTHQDVVKSPSEAKPVKLRFQNMVGLELSTAGCSILDFGGLDRLCEYALERSTDIFFQVGPAFSRIIAPTENVDGDTLRKHRAILWDEWSRQGVSFYAVSVLDLVPSLVEFESVARNGNIKLISTNLVTPDKARTLFEPYYIVTVGDKPLVFLSFTEPTASDAASWLVEDISISFKKILPALPKETEVYHVTGSLSASTRKKLALLSDKPIIFVGGKLTEQNTVSIVRESANSYWIKCPDLGRGLGEIELVPAKDNKDGVVLGRFSYGYQAVLLPRRAINSPLCARLIPKQTVTAEERKTCISDVVRCDEKK
ncbi:MAG: hypothetical protein HY537_02050 [Deltaproteobacteria bacterium]|nr:hypothetical protein [Deltaproteobacteria bacterium]